MLVRDGSVLPHIKLAQSTKDMDWSTLELVVFATKAASAEGLVCLPSDNVLHRITLPRGKGDYKLAANPLEGKSKLTVRMYNAVPKKVAGTE